MQVNKPQPDSDRPGIHAPADLEHARKIVAGSCAAWHDFVDRYSPLIFSVLRQVMFAEDEEEIRNVYVDILSSLYREKLSTFEGRSLLSTWLVLVARRGALDYLRKRGGRRRLPRGYETLSELEKRVFILHFVEGLDFGLVVHALNVNGRHAGVEAVALAVKHIQERIDRRSFRRIEFDRHARSVGAESGRALEYFKQLQIEYHDRTRQQSADRALLEEERRQAIDRLSRVMELLTPHERELLRCRYHRGWTGSRIARVFGLGGTRQAYRAIGRTIRRLRSLYDRDDAASESSQTQTQSEG